MHTQIPSAKPHCLNINSVKNTFCYVNLTDHCFEKPAGIFLFLGTKPK